MNSRPSLVRGRNDLLFDDQGKSYIDLHAGFGAVFMGHCHAGIARAVAQQGSELWACMGAPSQAYRQVEQSLAACFDGHYKLAELHSTGMEAVEFALRLSRVVCGKSAWVGFNGSMHGKSLATAALGWPSRTGATPTDCIRLPFLGDCAEDETLEQLRAVLAQQSVAAVLIEPLLGSSGGLNASVGFYQTVQALARQHGALLILDEILTGFHRTGTPFRYQALGLDPDVVVVGKACGNGFPVAAVMVRPTQQVLPQMLPGSTFGHNGLACAAVTATLHHQQVGDIGARVSAIAAAVDQHFGWLRDSPLKLRGSGALWVIELTGDADVQALLSRLREQGVWMSGSGRQIRLLPASTIELPHLHRACSVVADSLRALL